MYSVVPLCLVRAAILEVWDHPTMTSLPPLKPSCWKATVALNLWLFGQIEAVKRVELSN